MTWAGLLLLALFGFFTLTAKLRIQRLLAAKLWLDSLCVVLLGFAGDPTHSQNRILIFIVYFVGHVILFHLLMGQVVRTQNSADKND